MPSIDKLDAGFLQEEWQTNQEQLIEKRIGDATRY
jgi:hypothetical protein